MIVHSELLFGVENSKRKTENRAKLNEFLLPFEIIPYTEKISETYAEIRTNCKKKEPLWDQMIF